MSFPILYSKTTTDFSNLGLGILADAIDVKITEELNGAFELDMVYLARGILHEQLVYDAIIKTDTGDQSGQLFRIKKITKTIDKRLNIHAEHVSYVMNDYPVSVSTIVSNATAQTALNAWKSSIESVIGSSSGLTVYSDITTANDAKWTIDTFNNARDVLGGVEGSILDTWGGEFRFDNYRVNLLKQRGTTRDTIIAYGRNLTDLQQDESILETYTSVYPFATVNVKGAKNKADYTVIKTLPEKYVDSSYVNNYPMRRFLAVDFSDKFDDDKNKYSDASLRSLAKKYITSNKIGIPDVSITASVVDLEKAMNGGGSVERIDLGDVVQLNFTDVGINTSVEIVGTIYDVLRERYSEYTLGARKRTFSSIITGQINDVKKSVTRAQSDVISALISADGKSTNYYGSAEPTSPQEGDQWYWQDGPNSGIKQWHDGAWIDLVDTNTQAEIANSVTQAVAQAQSMDAALNQSINDSINETMTTVNTSLAVLDSEAAVFKSAADSATNSVASSAAAALLATSGSLAASTSVAVSSANKALSSAAGAASSAATALSQAGVNSLATSSVASDVNGLKASYTNLNSSAGVLTSQTASLAVSASSASAQFDKVSSTTGSLATETASLKISASSASAQFDKVNSSAGSLATQAASLAVSASSAAIGISNVTSSAGSLATQTASLAVSASSFATTVASMSSTQDSQTASINQLTQTATSTTSMIGEINNKLNDMGQVNQLTNTEFNPDLEGWTTSVSGSTKEPYRSYWQSDINGTVVGFNTTTGVASSFSKFTQVMTLPPSATSGHAISISWYAKAIQADNYNNIWVYFYDKDGVGISSVAKHWSALDASNPSGKNDWTIQNKWNNIPVPDTAITVSISFQAREGAVAYLGHPMVVFGTSIGAYAPGNYNNNGRVSVIEQDLDGIASTVSKHTSDINSVTTRVQTAEGSISTAQNNITGLQSSQTQTANQLQTEITNRTTGDSNTLTQAKAFTTSQITTYDTGIQSQFTQTSDSFIATLSAINQVIDSSLTNGLDMWQSIDNYNRVQTTQRFYKTSNVPLNGVPSIGYNQTALSGDYTSISTQFMTKNGWQASTLNVSVDVQARTIGTTATDYFIVYLSEWDDTNTRLALTNITGTISTSNGNWVNYRKKLTLNTNTTKVMLSYQMRGNGNVYISRPYVGVNELPAGAYVEGPVTNNTAMFALMADSYTLGLNSNGQLISGIMGNEKQVTLAGNAIHLDGNTTVSGDFYALGGNFKNLNASEIKTGTINASLINVININANNITTGKLNALLLTGNTGYLGTVNTGRVVNSQDNHLQLASYGFYDSTNDRAQVELLNNDSAISAEMRGSFNYYGNPTDKGNGLGIRMKYNQILAIDESGGSKNLYLSPYAGGQVRIVSRDLNTYYDIAAANFKVSSQRKFKENITSFPDGALDIVNNTTIRQYTKNGVDEIGVITDEAPKELISSTGEFVSIYDYVSILYKAVQELSTQVNELNRRPNNAT